MRDKILEMEAQWRELLTQMVRCAVALGQLREDLDVAQFVWELCGIYLAHHVDHRFLRSRDANRRAETAFRSLIDRSSLQVKAGAPARRKRSRNVRTQVVRG